MLHLNFCDPADDGDWQTVQYATLAEALAARAALPPEMVRVSITDAHGNPVRDDGTVARY